VRIFATGFQRRPQLCKEAARWGLAGAGMLYYCPYDQTVLLLQRSREVEDPGLWGIPGGAVKSGRRDYRGVETEWVDENEDAVQYPEEVLRDTAHGESNEELGHTPEFEEEQGNHTTTHNNFNYTTFLVTVSLQQKRQISRNIQLNWENDDFEWFRVDNLPENIHPGVVTAIEQLIYQRVS
jgi:8-oxo-dGTP pyrophosphatase MutT (NUDIX family)